jgi:hypothetical protein
MRLTEPMKRWPLIVAGLVLAGLGDGVAAKRANTAQCDIAWDYINLMISEPHDHEIVLSAYGPGVLIDAREDLTSYWFRHGGDRIAASSPPLDLVNSPTSRSAVQSCAIVREQLAERHVRFGSRVTNWARRVRRDRRFRADILSVSIAVLSADGMHAILEVNRAAYALESGQWFVHYIRDSDGSWHLDGERGV